MNLLTKSLNILFAVILLTGDVFASGHPVHYNDALLKTFIVNPKQLSDNEVQNQMASQSFWQNFVAQNQTWKGMFNENSGMPHRAFGKPIAVPGFDAKSSAENFMTNQLAEFRIPSGDLQFRSVSTNQKYHYVNYVQHYQGLEVLFSNVQVRMTHGYLVNQFALDCYPAISISTTPTLNENMAVQSASAGVIGIEQVIVSPALKVLPVPANGKYNYQLVYEIEVHNMDDEGIPGQYYTLVDASNGEILYRSNKVNHIAPTDINITGTLYLTNLYNPSTVEPMKYLRVVEGGNIYFADDNGFIGLNNTSATTASFSLQGRWVRIRTNNVTPTWSISLSPGVNNVNIDANNTDIKQRTTYNAINVVHDYMKSKYPTFTGLDNPLTSNIDVAGSCNAFYNGSSVNFFDYGGGCNASSLVADICYHEYGHAINDKFYQAQGYTFSNGSMNEGYADLWALGITASPILGSGFYDSNLSGIRRYDINKKVYPQDLIGEVHADGEIIAGCFWDTYLNLGNLQQMMDLFKETLYAGIAGPNGSEGTLYPDVLLETLAQDDNDGDITNGTPNYCPIVAAFELHGITLGTMFTPCAPIAMFTYQPAAVCEGVDIDFTDASFFSGTWDWSFPGGNPSTSTVQNPVVNYPTAGVYDVTLTVTNPAGTSSVTQTGIINVFPATGQYALPFYESFESISFPNTEWAIENSNGNGWSQNTQAAKTGVNSVSIDNFGSSSSGAVDVFYTPSYNLTGYVSNEMTFELAYAIQDTAATDKLRVYVSTTCGQLWNLRYTRFGANLATAGVITTPFIPIQDDWDMQAVNISSVAYNNKPNVRFKFEYTHDSGNNIYIDDININGLTGLNELSAAEIDFSIYPNPVSTVATVSFNLVKDGDVVIDVLDVLGREVNRITASRLEAGEYQFELPATLANGLYNVRITVDGASLSGKVLVNR